MTTSVVIYPSGYLLHWMPYLTDYFKVSGSSSFLPSCSCCTCSFCSSCCCCNKKKKKLHLDLFNVRCSFLPLLSFLVNSKSFFFFFLVVQQMKLTICTNNYLVKDIPQWIWLKSPPANTMFSEPHNSSFSSLGFLLG